MTRRILVLALCMALLCTLLPTAYAATADPPVPAAPYAVVEIPIVKTVEVGGSTAPDAATFELEITEINGPEPHLFSVVENGVTVTGAGVFNGVLKLSFPTEGAFWDMSEGIVLREKNTGLAGWEYDATEWCVALGTDAAGSPMPAIFNKTAGEEIDYGTFAGAHNAITLTNTYTGTNWAPQNPVPGTIAQPTAANVILTIPYIKTVEAPAGTAFPEKKFTLAFGELAPDVIADCVITGETFKVGTAGQYADALTIHPKTDYSLGALLQQGFTITELAADDAQWQCDKTEWFVKVTQAADGTLGFTLYNLTKGENPTAPAGTTATTVSHDHIEFTNVYTPAQTPEQTPEKTAVTFSFYPEGGTLENPKEEHKIGEEVPLEQVPTRDGYIFVGWKETPNGDVIDDPVKADKDKEFHAVWQRTPVPDELNGADHTAYVKGYPDNTVKPLNPITRAEVTTIFYRLLKDEIRKANYTTENTFDDVKSGDWFNEAVSTMAKLGIIKGRSATVFDPNAPITRAEYAAICARFDKTEVKTLTKFTDLDGHWAKELVEHAAALGWVKGYSDGSFKPNNRITRAESMTLTNRVLQRLPQSTDDLLKDMKVFPDNADAAVWYYLPVQEAINGHEYTEKDDGYEAWTALKN